LTKLALHEPQSVVHCEKHESRLVKASLLVAAPSRVFDTANFKSAITEGKFTSAKEASLALTSAAAKVAAAPFGMPAV